ncbi:MAG: MFS transporter [Cyclobacteriaceae bacterium]|nr:MFS transporter [Cyclobacteriaceae bacterium SS2]
MEGDPKIIRSWCMYDWANSVYNLVINTSIFPIYYTAITASETTGDKVSFFGFEIVNSVLYSYALSFSYLLSAMILPLLSGIADYTGKKMTFLKIFTFLGAFSCMGMFLFTKGNIEWGIFCVIFASLGYSSSLVFYDAYLPEIASPEETDRVSARGYAFGYLGSALMLIMSLVLITFYETFGFENSGQATRIVFLLVGIWWIGFAQIPFRTLPVNVFHKKPKGRILLNGYREIRSVFFKLKTLSNMKKYILAFLFFNMGVQTVMLLATLFGSKVLHLEAGQLIPILLIIQFVGIAGSLLFARLSDKKGNIFSLTFMIIIWIGICIYAFFITNVTQFYLIAVLVGLVMGGIQALSRATFSKLIPEDTEDHASYFSFFDVTFHISVVLGTFSYGLIEQITGSMRNSSLALGLFFLIGLVLLRFVKMPPYGKA